MPREAPAVGNGAPVAAILSLGTFALRPPPAAGTKKYALEVAVRWLSIAVFYTLAGLGLVVALHGAYFGRTGRECHGAELGGVVARIEPAEAPDW